ncbi:MAG: hypothetical protein FWD78_07335 [Treponema sp.]|nr:hypothetical protein [Treponema sp.]
MEDNKKILQSLEAGKAETQKLLDNLLENIGESLISQMELTGSMPNSAKPSSAEDGGDSPLALLGEKNRLLREISDSQENIGIIEADLSLLSKLEEDITRTEREKNDKAREIPPANTELGRFALKDPAFENFNASFERSFNDITLKIDFQQKKLEELNNTDGYFLSKIGNGVKGMMARATLSKSEGDLEKLYRSAGEQFLAGVDNPSSGKLSQEELSLAQTGEIAGLVEKAKDLRNLQISLKDEIERYRLQRRATTQALDQKGNPARRISELEMNINKTKDEVRKVHLRFGALVRKSEWKKPLASLLKNEEPLYEKITALDESLEITEKKIEYTKAAIAIENEKADIAGFQETIKEKQQTIEEAQASITEIETKIKAAQDRIDGLTEKYGKD